MASDRLVTPGHVLKAVMELQRRGSRLILSEWERLEPDLTEYMLESLTSLHHKLAGAGLSGTETRRLYRQAETIVVVCLTSLRRAQREVWGDGEEGASSPSPADTGPPGT